MGEGRGKGMLAVAHSDITVMVDWALQLSISSLPTGAVATISIIHTQN